MRLIDADALMKTLGITDMDCDKCAWHDREWSNCKRGGDFEDACCAIENAPTIEERKTGKWIFIGNQMFECSECGTCYTQRQFYQMRVRISDPEFPKFCPNCGADMRGEQDGRDD